MNTFSDRPHRTYRKALRERGREGGRERAGARGQGE